MSDLFFGELSTDVIPPEVTNASPANGLTGVDGESNIEFDITDTETGVDTASVVVYIDGTKAYDGGFEAGYAGSFVDMGGGTWHMVIGPAGLLPSYENIVVTVDAQDLAPIPNVMAQYSWAFDTRDYEPPYTDNEFPTGTDIAKNTLIEVDIKDDGIGVDLAEVIIKVNGVEAYSSGAFQAGFQGPSSAVNVGGAPALYHFTIDPLPELSESTSYTVSVVAKDQA